MIDFHKLGRKQNVMDSIIYRRINGSLPIAAGMGRIYQEHLLGGEGTSIVVKLLIEVYSQNSRLLSEIAQQ